MISLAGKTRATSAWPTTDRQALAVIALYFGLHFLLRVLAPESLELDEGAELMRTQELRLGYDTQPPLYTWILFPLIQLFGPAVWLLALVKNLLLFGTHSYVYAAARHLDLPPATALVACGSLLLIPQIGWESQRDLTHSVLVTHAAAGSLLVSLKLLRRQTVWHYTVLGLLLTVGILAKYNFAVFALALLLAASSLPQTRRILSRPLITVTIALLLLGILPHALWLLGDWSSASAGSLRKMGVDEQMGVVASLTAVIAGLGQFLGLFAVAAGACLLMPRLRRRPLRDLARVGGPLLTRLHLLSVALVMAIAVSFGMDDVKDRWLQPLFFAVPLWLFAYLDWEALARWRRHSYRIVLVAVAGALVLGRAIDIHGSRYFDKPTRMGTPFAELIDGIGVPSDAVVLTNTNHLGGGIRLLRPDLDVYAPSRRTQPPSGDCYLVWQPAKKRIMRTYHAWLQEVFAGPSDLLATREPTVTIPYRSNKGEHQLYVAAGRCRALPQ